jgi:hypothetical protein
MPFGRSGRTLTRTPKFPIEIYRYGRPRICKRPSRSYVARTRAGRSEQYLSTWDRCSPSKAQVRHNFRHRTIYLYSVCLPCGSPTDGLFNNGGEGWAMLLNVCIRLGTLSAI